MRHWVRQLWVVLLTGMLVLGIGLRGLPAPCQNGHCGPGGCATAARPCPESCTCHWSHSDGGSCCHSDGATGHDPAGVSHDQAAATAHHGRPAVPSGHHDHATTDAGQPDPGTAHHPGPLTTAARDADRVTARHHDPAASHLDHEVASMVDHDHAATGPDDPAGTAATHPDHPRASSGPDAAAGTETASHCAPAAPAAGGDWPHLSLPPSQAPVALAAAVQLDLTVIPDQHGTFLPAISGLTPPPPTRPPAA